MLSDWRVELVFGKCRVEVPDVAQGFVVEAADAEIVDLGTEFVVESNEWSTRVAVVDGEVLIHSEGSPNEVRLTTGQSSTLAGDAVSLDPKLFATRATLTDQVRASALQRYESWKSSVKRVSDDARVIAHFPIGLTSDPSRKRQQYGPMEVASDAVLIGNVRSVVNRFGVPNSGLNFSHPASRMRFRIGGEYEAITMACWVRIDALAQPFNSLAMTDSYDPGEPHWQISQDGRLMLSVMAGGEEDSPANHADTDWVVWKHPWHRVYHSPAIWDMSQSGRWMHLASVYDIPEKQVRHYRDGELISRHRISPKHLVPAVRFGNMELGNWGQPYRRNARFAVRNLHGAIDEFIAFGTALEDREIRRLFESGAEK